MSEIPPIVLALAQERESYRRSNRPERFIPIDEQLAACGYCVTADGKIVAVSESLNAVPTVDAAPETTLVESAPENTAAPTPVKRGPGRPRKNPN